ncbi:MAG: EamA family transporter [Candidatus Andersenbacteria bacterium]
MNWLLLAVIPPLLYAVVNHFDKYLVQRYFKGASVGAVLIFSALIGIFVAIPIGIFVPEVFDLPARHSALIVANGFLYLLASLPYFYALSKDEASVVVPVFQLVPFFILLFAFIFLGETISLNGLLGGAVVVLGAVLISLELSHKKAKFKQSVFWLMVLSSSLFALNFVLFKNLNIDSTFWITNFWEYVGFVLFAAFALVCIPPYRRQFFSVFKQNKKTVLALNGINEIIAVAAKASFNFASLLAPVALVSFVGGLQPLFVFLIGIALTLFFPKISKENIDARHLIQKIVAILVILVGVWMLSSA